MTIYEGSRYEYARTILDVGSDGVPRTVLETLPRKSGFITFTAYTVREGERIEQLGARFFGDPELWWHIADANPQFIYWDSLPTGLALRIPSG